METDTILTGISSEIEASLEAMGNTKKPDEKLMYSETIKNLCESMGVFVNLLHTIMPYDEEDDEDPLF